MPGVGGDWCTCAWKAFLLLGLLWESCTSTAGDYIFRVGRKKLSLQTLIISLQVVSTLYHIVIQTWMFSARPGLRETQKADEKFFVAQWKKIKGIAIWSNPYFNCSPPFNIWFTTTYHYEQSNSSSFVEVLLLLCDLEAVQMVLCQNTGNNKLDEVKKQMQAFFWHSAQNGAVL